MIELIIYSGAAFGLAYVLGYSKISLPIRVLIEPVQDGMKVQGTGARLFWAARMMLLALLECPACLGWHCGFVTAYLLRGHIYFLTGFLDAPTFVAMLALAFFTSGSNFILGRVTGLIEKE